jgi:GTP-binding protein HflX
MKTDDDRVSNRAALGVKANHERALLVGLSLGARGRMRSDASVEELGLLAHSAGAVVVGRLVQERQRPDGATLIGRGKVLEVRRLAEEREANLILFDEDLSPAQQRNLEAALDQKTLDRTQLILDIFAKRARTREGRLQVELAQLAYLLPRLAGRGVRLSRHGGGIGTRGPGETKLETDRRRIRQRIQAIRRDIEKVKRERRVRREARTRTAAPLVALVGYTNAGKSTLFSALSRTEDAPASSLLFMTLDPLVRRARLGPASEILLVDTVGFIQKLPHSLVDAFRATLEEVVAADLLLHVVDASAEDQDEREAAVETVLGEIGATSRPRIVVLNKADVTPEARGRLLQSARAGSVLVSAQTGAGLDALTREIASRLELGPRRVRLRFSAEDARGIGEVYSSGQVLTHERNGNEVRLTADLPGRVVERYREKLR